MTPGTCSSRGAFRRKLASRTGSRSTSLEPSSPQPRARQTMAEVFDARAIFRVLAEHGVEYIVVGGLAVQTHGFLRSTVDLDIVPRPDLANLSRLGEALISMD